MTKNAFIYPTLLILLFLNLSCSGEKKFMRKIKLKEGRENIEIAKDLKLETLLQIYGENSKPHLVGDIYFGVKSNGEDIAGWYVDSDNSRNDYSTIIFKNYFLTFNIENEDKSLIIEKSKLGKFALSSKRSAQIENKDDILKLEITDFIYEWGYTGPPGDDNRNYYSDVRYTLRVKINDAEKSFNFNSSELKDKYRIDFEGYDILLLSDKYKHEYSLVEMIISKKH